MLEKGLSIFLDKLEHDFYSAHRSLFKGFPQLSFSNGEGRLILDPIKGNIFFAAVSGYKDIERFISDNSMKLLLNTHCLENLSLVVTSRCNLHCSYCFGPTNGFDDMNPQLLPLRLPQLLSFSTSRSGYYPVVLFGGEPSMNLPIFKAIVRFAQEWCKPCLPILLKIDTNGYFGKQFRNFLPKAGPVIIQFSWDGDKGGAKLRYGRQYHRIFKVVKKNIAFCSQLENVLISIRITLGPHNAHELPEIIDWFGKTCPDDKRLEVVLGIICPHKGNALQLDYSFGTIDKFGPIFRQALRASQRYAIPLQTIPFGLLNAGANASFHLHGFVSPDWQVISFTSVPEPDTIIGTFNEKGYLQLDFSRMSLLSENFIKNHKRFCSGCFTRSLCKGTSKAIKFMRRSDYEKGHEKFFSRDGSCKANRDITQALIIELTRTALKTKNFKEIAPDILKIKLSDVYEKTFGYKDKQNYQ